MAPTAFSPSAAIICRAAPMRGDLRTLREQLAGVPFGPAGGLAHGFAAMPPSGATRAATAARSASTGFPALAMAAAAGCAAGSNGVPAAGQQASSAHR